MKSLLLASALAVAVSASAQAADIGVGYGKRYTADRSTYHPEAIIYIVGRIVPGDLARFNAVAQSYPAGTFVALASPGGAAIEGMSIGQVIRSKGFNTVVYKDDVCASACALMWLAGNSRSLSMHGAVGFHAVSDAKTGRESGSGSALAGAYMAHLGYSYDAIEWATYAPPDKALWISLESNAIGITWNVHKEIR